MRSSLVFGVLALLCACAPKTGMLFSVSGPKGKGAVAALDLVVAHPSYCDRWVTDETATGQHYDVHSRDLSKSPLSILLVPDHRTDLGQAVRAMVIARDASNAVIGYAAFGAHSFRFEKVDEYKGTIVLTSGDARSVAADGCACFAGQPEIGTGSGTGCDALMPPSFARLQDTAGCELPSGATLPVGVCDGQLYPGETASRTLPCFATDKGDCKIGTRVCADQNAVAYTGACNTDNAPTLPSSALCDAFATCEQTACADPLPCMSTEITTHVAVQCTLPAMQKDDGLTPCGDGDWSFVIGAQTGTACTAAMLSGTQVGPMTLGFAADNATGAQVTSSMCPPTLEVDAVTDSSAGVQTFSMTLGDTIYDVEITPVLQCSDDMHLHCTGF